MLSLLARIVAVMAATLLFPVAAAYASGTISLSGTQYTWIGSSAADTLTVSGITGTTTRSIRFRSATPIQLTSIVLGVCSSPGTTVTCNGIVPAGTIGSIRATGFDGADSLVYDDGAPTCTNCLSLSVDFDGGAGNDTLIGSELGDDLLGGSGADSIDAESGVDDVDGGADDDTIRGGTENDRVNGGDGSGDRIRYDEPSRAAAVEVNLSDGTGSDGGPTETTEDALGFERIIGTRFGDELTGDGGANVLDGGGGDDVLRGAGGTDALRGGAGADTASYSERTESVAVSLDGTANDGAPGEDDAVAADVENAIGGAGGDSLTGNERANALDGGPGADSIAGLGGVDAVDAGDGDDAVSAIDGNDESIDCGDGTDVAEADAGDLLAGCEQAAIASALADGDADGFPESQDCDDADPARHPDAPEIPGNDVDEDCDGTPQDFELIGATISSAFTVRGRRTQVNRLTVKSIPAGGRVRLTCKPPKGRRTCPFKRVDRKLRRATRALKLLPRFKGRRLPVGTELKIRVTAPLAIGKVLRFKTRDARLPRKTSRCQEPGRSRLLRCP